MHDWSFSSLTYLSLGWSYIGDEGVQKLVTNLFPKLEQLRLVDIDLTVKGIQYLGRLEAPKLIELDLSCNELSAD